MYRQKLKNAIRRLRTGQRNSNIRYKTLLGKMEKKIQKIRKTLVGYGTRTQRHGKHTSTWNHMDQLNAIRGRKRMELWLHMEGYYQKRKNNKLRQRSNN